MPPLRAIEESLKSYNLTNDSPIDDDEDNYETIEPNEQPMQDDLERAINLSQLQQIEDEKKRQRADELELEKVLKISLIEK